MEAKTIAYRLIVEFEDTVKIIIRTFENKQELIFDYAVGGDLLDVLWFDSLYYFSLQNIIHDLKTNQPKGKIVEWFEYNEINNKFVNYKSYCMGAR